MDEMTIFEGIEMWYVCKNTIEIAFNHNAHPIQRQILIAGPMTKDSAIDKARELTKNKEITEHYTILEMIKHDHT